MKRYFEKLQKKPEAHRKKIASIFAGVVTTLIVVIWILILVFVKNNSPQKPSGFEQFDKFIRQLTEQSMHFDEIIENKKQLSACGPNSLDLYQQEKQENLQKNESLTNTKEEGCGTDETRASQVQQTDEPLTSEIVDNEEI